MGASMEIYKRFTFDAAHSLTGVPANHKCSRLHGHTYELIVFLAGEPDKKTGFISDYADIAVAVGRVLAPLDHHNLNDVDARLLHNPTTENLCLYLWPRLKAELPELSRIEVKESATTGCVYTEVER